MMKSFLIGLSACLAPSALADKDWDWSFGGTLENTYFYADQPTPSLLKFQNNDFLQSRLSLNLDVLRENWYFHATARLDRGFDAGNAPDGRGRIDEIFLRYQPLGDRRLKLQLGKFATVFGSNHTRDQFFDSPFLLSALPYGELVGIGVLNPQANSPESILARVNGIAPGIYKIPKRNWAAQIWGPAYTSGAAIFGTIEKFDYAFEVKNVEPGAHPEQWNFKGNDFDSPTFTGRIGYRPSADWNLGLSFSRGPYLNLDAERLLPTGVSRGDLPHTMLGMDLRWSRGDFIFSGEVILNRYETLSNDELESLSWYLQTRWKASPSFWLAARVGQTLSNDARGPSGESLPWTPDLFRGEIAAGWKINPDVLLKTQYSHTASSGGLSSPGENVFGLGLGWRF